MKNNTIAIYAGSFDPFTIGHLSILERALNIFDKVVIAIGTNPSKKDSGLFSLFDREHIIKASIPEEYKSRVDVRCFNTLLLHFANLIKNENPDSSVTIVRGLRSFQDFESEMKLFDFNSKNGFDTVPLFSQSGFNDVSSSTFKELWSFGEKKMACDYVTPNAVKYIIHYSDHALSNGLIKSLFTDKLKHTVGGENLFITLKNDIVRHLFEPDRYYHNWLHPIDLWEFFTNLNNEFKFLQYKQISKEHLGLAIIYHDVIYDSKAAKGENETASAEMFMDHSKHLFFNAGRQTHNKVYNAIIATTHEDKDHGNDLSNMMVDLDLLGFANELSVVEKNAQNIRREYSWVDDKSFNMGRAGFMKAFMERVNLFKTPEIREKYEKIAKENLNKEYARYLNIALLD